MTNDRFRDRYRIQSTRLPGWDYTTPGWYFVTVCVKNRECRLGDVVSDRFGDALINLSLSGRAVLAELMETQVMRPYIAIDEYAIMPNHVHVLIEIHTDPKVDVTLGTQLKSDSLGVLIGAWKAKATARIRAGGDDTFAWQERFYDAVIHDDAGIERVRAYIRDNPKNWPADRAKPSGVYM